MSKYRKKLKYVQHRANELNTSIKGSINELVVCTYFLQRGYEVFRNVSPTGKGDIVIWDGIGAPIVIDVKTAREEIGKTKLILYMNRSKHPNVKTVGVIGNNRVLEDITK